MATEEKTVKVRMLTRGDRVTLTNMITDLAKCDDMKHLVRMIVDYTDELKVDEKDKKEASNGEQLDKMTPIAGQLFALLQERCLVQIEAWFKDLIGVKTDEEFNAMPLDVEIRIIEQIIDRPEFKSFFSGASRLLNPIRLYTVQYMAKKSLSGIISNSQKETSAT